MATITFFWSWINAPSRLLKQQPMTDRTNDYMQSKEQFWYGGQGMHLKHQAII